MQQHRWWNLLNMSPPESQCQSLSMPGGSFSLLQSKQQWQSHSRFALVPSCRGSAYSARRTCISCGQLCGFAPFSAFLGVVWAYANGVNFFSSVAHITQWVNSVQVVSGIMSQQAGGWDYITHSGAVISPSVCAVFQNQLRFWKRGSLYVCDVRSLACCVSNPASLLWQFHTPAVYDVCHKHVTSVGHRWFLIPAELAKIWCIYGHPNCTQVDPPKSTTMSDF